MPDQGTPTVIFFGHGHVADQVRRNLTDLATLGLTDPFYWIDPRLPVHGSTVRRIAATQDIVTLDTTLNGVTGQVLLIALDADDDTTDGIDFTSVERWTESIDNRLFSDRARIRVLIPRLPRRTSPLTPNPSWTSTVALAPEDSQAPKSTLHPVRRTDDPTAVARTAAPALCGLTGLWRSATTCPLLEEGNRPISTGDIDQVRLARSYHRIVDSSAVEDQLRREATDIRGRLPQPKLQDGTQIRYEGENSTKPADMADAFIREHHSSLAIDLQPEAVQPNTKLGWFKALVGFLKRYFSEGLGSPRSWGRALLASANDKTAGFIQKSLYGDDSPVRVISNPVENPGQQLSLDQIAEETSKFQRAAGSAIRIGDDPQLSRMWTSYRDVALTLVDGAEREQGNLGAWKDAYNNRYIVEKGWQSVPDRDDDSFLGANPLLGQRLGMTTQDATLEPYDAHKALAYGEGLNFVASQTQDPQIRRLQEGFETWKQKASRSFAWRTGEYLGQLIDRSRHSVSDQIARLDHHQGILNQQMERDVETARRRHRRNTLVLLGLLALLNAFLSASVTLNYKEEWQQDWFAGFSPWWALLWGVLGAGLLMFIHMASFANARRGVEKYIQDRTLAEQNVRIADANVKTAVANLARQVSAYKQMLSWSALLGRAISRPFGRDLTSGKALNTPEAGMPLATGIGQSVLPEDRKAPLVSLARERMFGEGWARTAFDILYQDTAASIEKYGSGRISNLSQLTGQSGAGTGSELDTLANWAVSERMKDRDRDRTREHWATVMSTPETAAKLSELLDTVTVFDHGSATQVRKSDFLSILDQEDATAGSFHQDVLAPVAAGGRATEMDVNVCQLERSDETGGTRAAGTLTRSVTLTQFGHVTAMSYLVDSTGPTGSAPTAPLPEFGHSPLGTGDLPSAPSTESPGATREPNPGQPSTTSPLPQFPGGNSLI